MRFLPFRHADSVAVPPPAVDRGLTVDLTAYSDDCQVAARYSFDAPRLVDALAHEDVIHLEGVSLTSFEDGHTVRLETLDLDPEELCCVAAAGPRGDPARRLRTRPDLVMAAVGPFAVLGFLHSSPTIAASSMLPRRPFVPVTSATLVYRAGTAVVERRHETLLLNRDHIRRLDPAPDPTVAPAALLEMLEVRIS